MSRTPNRTESAVVFAALGDATRLELVSRLRDGRSHSITELTAGLKLTRQGVTKHLHVLEQARIVSRHRTGRVSRYKMTPASMDRARAYLTRLSTQWDEAIERLRASVED